MLLSVILLLVVLSCLFLSQPKFGKLPSGERLERIKQSPNYSKNSFHNIIETPDLTEGVSYFSVFWQFLFGNADRLTPSATIPSVKTDLLTLPPDANTLVWFGHSSYFIQLDGKKILVDPVLSGVASPVYFSTRAFKGTDRYTVDDLPEIDYLFISHDHWDHLDYPTILQLKDKVKKVISGLGTGSHFEYWGYSADKLIELDWYDQVDLDLGFKASAVPARHFSGRAFARNKSLWTSFVLKSTSSQIFIGGDSGYSGHFAEIGERFGEFDLAVLENGQYDKSWKYIHLMPDELLKAAADLKAKKVFPVHSSKFVLANHPWDEPLELVIENNKKANMNVITPMIGELVDLTDPDQVFQLWWRGVQ